MSSNTKLPPPAPPADEIPPTTFEWEYRVIDHFLRNALDSTERTLNDHRAQAMTDRTDRLRGLIEYFRHQKATIEDLISRNHASAHAQRPRKPR